MKTLNDLFPDDEAPQDLFGVERTPNPQPKTPVNQTVDSAGSRSLGTEGGGSLSGTERHLGAPESEREISIEGHPWPRPGKRIVDGTAEPMDSKPIDENYCPLCKAFVLRWDRAHVVGRGVGGDDVPENLFWACTSCHTSLHVDGMDSVAARRLVRYCRDDFPELGEYADEKKYPGYIERRYLGT